MNENLNRTHTIYKLLMIGTIPNGSALEFDDCLSKLTASVRGVLDLTVVCLKNADPHFKEWADFNDHKYKEVAINDIDVDGAVIFWDGQDNLSYERSLIDFKRVPSRLIRTDRWLCS